MSGVIVKVRCPLPGLEGVTVHYDLMASDEMTREFGRTNGAKHDGIVAQVEGWPKDKGDPWGDESPIAFRLWAVHHGFMAAIRAFRDDPSWLTA